MQDIIKYILFPYGIVAILSFVLTLCLIYIMLIKRKTKKISFTPVLMNIIACFLISIAFSGYSLYLYQDVKLQDYVIIEETRLSKYNTDRIGYRRGISLIRPIYTNFTFTTKTDTITLKAQQNVAERMKVGKKYKIRYAKRTKILLQVTEIPEEKVNIQDYLPNHK